MARPLRLHVPGMVYHVMCRGNARQSIFEEDRDYERFLELLGHACKRFRIECLAFCLLRNHFHLLLKPSEIPLSRMMQQLNSVYCQGFNRRHNRVGHVLQGRYKALLVETPDYFLTVVRYIMLNPVAAKCASNPEDWRWSSFRPTAGLEVCPEFLNVEEVWGSLGAPDERTGQDRFAAFVRAPSDPVRRGHALILGAPAFVERFRSMLLPLRKVDGFVRREKYADRPTLLQIMGNIVGTRARALAARSAFQEYAYTLAEIGRFAARAPSTVWFWIHRVATAPVRHRWVEIRS